MIDTETYTEDRIDFVSYAVDGREGVTVPVMQTDISSVYRPGL